MKAIISTIIQANENKMWEALQRVSSLAYVASPCLLFKFLDGSALPEKWEPGKEYALSISAFHFIPLGNHFIGITTIDAANKEMLSNEHGTLIKEWNHRIKVEKIDEGRIKYSDEIEIKAGALTLLVWFFAHSFYRHRQRRWKKLIAHGQTPGFAGRL